MSNCKDCGAPMIPGAISDGWCSAECGLEPKDTRPRLPPGTYDAKGKTLDAIGQLHGVPRHVDPDLPSAVDGGT